MLEFGQILAIFSGIVLVIAVGAWIELARNSAFLPINRRERSNAASTKVASQLMLLAFGLSAIAAVFAVSGWIELS